MCTYGFETTKIYINKYLRKVRFRSFIRTFEGTKVTFVIIKNLPGTDRANSFKSDYEGPFPGASA